MAGLLFWITLGCTGVPDEDATECITHQSSFKKITKKKASLTRSTAVASILSGSGELR